MRDKEVQDIVIETLQLLLNFRKTYWDGEHTVEIEYKTLEEKIQAFINEYQGVEE